MRAWYLPLGRYRATHCRALTGLEAPLTKSISLNMMDLALRGSASPPMMSISTWERKKLYPIDAITTESSPRVKGRVSRKPPASCATFLTPLSYPFSAPRPLRAAAATRCWSNSAWKSSERPRPLLEHDSILSMSVFGKAAMARSKMEHDFSIASLCSWWKMSHTDFSDSVKMRSHAPGTFQSKSGWMGLWSGPTTWRFSELSSSEVPIVTPIFRTNVRPFVSR
mmetsp:Transcript_37400/g.107089  ORF Transcript_37400/g.107089 Transcript_37400/m.107089 type:complete len:224 (-) Transcript_37400:101-772(-)